MKIFAETKKRFKLSMIIMLLVASVISPSVSNAYEYYGWWNDPYKMIPGISSGTYIVDTIDNYNYNGKVFMFQTAWNSAMEEWNNRTEANIQNSINVSGPERIRMRAGNYGNVGLQGWVTVYKNNVVVGDGDETPLPVTSSWDYAIAHLSAHSLRNYTYPQYRAVAIHELGHALGLNHENDGTPSIMNDQLYPPNSYLVPQQDDINGINNLY